MGKKLRKLYGVVRKPLTWALTVMMVTQLFPTQAIAEIGDELFDAPDQPIVEVVPEEVTTPEETAQQVADDVTADEPAAEPADVPVVVEPDVPDTQPEVPDTPTVPETPADKPVPAEDVTTPDVTPEPAETPVYPAQKLVAPVKDDRAMSVQVIAPEGALPEGARLVATKVDSSEVADAVEAAAEEAGKNVGAMVAVDVTILDADGNEIQPLVPVTVRFFNANVAGNEISVYHIEDETGEAAEVEDSFTMLGYQRFEADGFSIYVVVDTGSDARAKVEFRMPDGTLIDSMLVKQNDDKTLVIYEPNLGDLDEGVIFSGWSKDPNYKATDETLSIQGVRDFFGSGYDWSTVVDAESDEGTPTVEVFYAVLLKKHAVTYLDDNGATLGEAAAMYRADATEVAQEYQVNQGYIPTDDFHDFEGWNVAEGGDYIAGHTEGKTYANETIITISGDVVFSVYAPEGHWLVFNENGKGATYNAPQFVYSNGVTKKPCEDSAMVRNGYTFGGWYKDAACTTGNEFTFGTTISERTTIYAKWIPITSANYTVIIWKQKSDGSGYDFERAISLTGNVNTNVNTVSSQSSGDSRYARINGTNYQYTGFHLDRYDQNVTIKPEGSSLVNVYYNRNEYTLTFQDHPYTATTSGSGTQYALIDGQYVQLTRYSNNSYWYNGQRYFGTRYTQGSGWTTVKEIKALYQQNISDNFPIVGSNGATYNHGERWDPQSNTPYSEVLVFIDVMPAANVTFHLDVADRTTKHIHYYVEALPGTTGNTRTYNGMTFVEYKSIDANYSFFTEAEDYIDLVGYTKGGTTYPPEAYNSNGGKLNTVWNNSDASDVYCYYTRNSYAINFMDGAYVDGNGNPLDEANRGQLHEEDNIAYGADISSYEDYAPAAYQGYVFEGWYADVSCSQKYDFNTMPEGGITVYAKWRQIQYRVFLHPQADTDPTLDWGSDSQAMNFRVNYGETVSVPTGRRTGYTFLGWYLDAEGSRVYNAELYRLNDTSVWENYDKTTHMTDKMDKWGVANADPSSGHSTPWNSDITGFDGEDRFWITRELNLYGKWSKVLDGADGVYVIYNVGQSPDSAPVDNNLYVDNALATAAASVTAPEGYQFDHWVMQQWDEAEGGYVDIEGSTIYAGTKFNVLSDLAHKIATGEYKKNSEGQYVDSNGNPTTDPTKYVPLYTYTVQLRAEFKQVVEAPPTYIPWYKNDGNPAYHIDTLAEGATDVYLSTLGINEAVDILEAPTREGYSFVGWARVETGYSIEDAAAFASNSDNYELEDLTPLLYYNKDNGKFYTDADYENEATQVAADENTPYHAMFAVWQEELNVRITGNTDTKTYNGNEQSVTGYTVEYKVGTGEWTTTAPTGVSVSLKAGKAAEAKGTNVNTNPGYLMGLTLADFDVVSGAYNYDPNSSNNSYTDGWLKIEPADLTVTITGNTDTKTYNGSEQSVTGYTISIPSGATLTEAEISGPAQDEAIASGTDANTDPGYAMGLSADDFSTTNANYNVTFSVTDGWLKITPADLTVTITGNTDTKTYNGSEQSVTGYTVSIPTGATLTAAEISGPEQTAAIASGTDVNTDPGYAMGLTAGQFSTTNTNYNVTFSVTDGWLKISKATLTITANDQTHTYNGSAQGEDNATYTDASKVSVSGLQGSDQLTSITLNGQETNVDEYAGKIVPSAAQIGDATGNYDITYVAGKLTITPMALTITAGSDTKVYDGTALTKDSYTSTDLATGDHIESVTITGSQTVVGESDNVPSGAVIKNAAGGDVTGNYTITYANGTLKVTVNKSVIITADSDTKVYDGTALTKNSYQVSGLAAGDRVESVTITGSQTVVGTSNNVPSAAKIVNAAGVDVTSSYEISYANGTLEVTKKPVTITAGSDTKVYDGTPLTKDSYTNTDLAAGDSIDSVTVTGSQTVAGTSNNVPSGAVIKNAAGEDVTSSYEITYANGTLEVTKKDITITAGSDEKVYDGRALTKNSYTNTDLAEGDSIESVTVTGSQTVVGTSSNVPSAAVIKNAAGDDVTASYNVTYANGTLKVTKKAVTITADSDTKVYDGTALTKDSYTNTTLAEGDTIESVTVTGSQTVVGSSDNVPSAAVIKNAAGTDVTASYDITYVNGTLEVTKKAITITADSDTKVYDGTALTKDSYANTDLADGDSIESVTVTGSQTVVGSSNNVPSAAVIKSAAGTDVTSSYEITYANGTLEVTKKAVTITAGSDTKVYDGSALTKDSYTNTALATGDAIESVTVTGSQTVVGTSNNVPSAAIIKNAAGADVTASYDITYVNGTLEVTKKALTITADSDSKVYDGSALTKNSYTNTDLAEGDSIESVTVTGSQTIVGSSDNVPSAAVIKNAAGADVTSSYDITYTNGTLEVTKKSVTITADSDTKVYDGTPLTKDSYTNTALASGDSIESVTVTGSQTVVGTSDNVPSAAKIVNGAGEDVTASYDITYANGTLEVTKKAVTITADSDTKVYDGTPLTKDSYTNTALATGDSVDSVTVTGSQTVVGSSNNVPSAAKIVNGDGEDVTASYEITYANGTLEVTQKAVTITADSDTKVYDGTPLTKNSYTNTALATDDSIESVTVTGSQTVVGSSDNVPSAAVIKNAAGEDVTASYDITYANGTLEVTKKALTITADSDTKVYDGTALTKDSYTNTDLASGDSIESVTVTGSQTVVGSSDNVPSAAVIKNAAGEDVTASYDITYANGTLEVTKKALTITADSDTKVYDGTPLTKNSYTNTALATDDSIESVTVTGSQTVVGSSDNVPSAAVIKNAAGEDVTASYEITYANGTLEVTLNQSLIITADSDTKVYDGTALTKDSYQVAGLAEGDSVVSVTVTGSQTVAGTSDNVPSAAKIVNAAGEDVTASYEITYKSGTLEVTQKPVTITADSDTKVYDGTPLTKNSYTNTALAEGDSIDSVTVTGSQTVVGSSDNVPSAAVIKNAAGEDVTASYDITYANGTLEVTKKALTITADSDTKVYDGTALTKDSYTNTDLASGDSIESVTVTGSQTVVGSSDNVPSAAVIKNAAGEDVTASYDITYANGTLEVTKKSITITADSDTKVYDGSALTKDSYTNTDLATGDSIESVTVTGSQTVVGSSDNVPSAAKIVNAAGEDVTASYDITYENGTLEVTQKSLTITADSDEKVYDGSALTKDSYTNTDLATGDTIESVTVTGSQTVVGTSDNVPSAAVIKNAAGEDVTASYDITYENGTLEVTQKSLTITADSDEKVYDGTALTKDSYTNTDLATGDTIESVTVTGSQTVVGTSDNVPSAAVIKNAAGEDVTASYDITYENGTLEVTKKALTITADSDTKVYDGSALTKDSYTNTDLATGDSIESVTVTGSQTVVGTSDNVPSAASIKNAAGEDVTSSYNITYENGTLEVTQKSLTITADSDTKVYDGTPLTKNSYTNTALAEGDTIESVTVTGSQTVVGSSDNVPSAAKIVNADGEDVTSSYDITYANGTLQVTKNQALIITAGSDTKVYDGTALTKNSYQVAGLAEGDSVESVTVTGSQTVVGTSDNVPSAAKIVNADGEDVTASYEVTYQNGTLEVTQKALTITADSDEKVYDGTALTKDSYTNTALATGDSIESVTVTGSQTVVGTSDNVPSAAKIVNADGEDVTASYKITYENGTLEVTQKTLTITADSDSKVYDGTALTKDTYTNTALAEGDSIESVTVTGSQTVVGTSDNVPSAAVIKNAAGEDVTASYKITYENGTLEVTQKTLTITADSDEKVYDGTALTKDSYTNTALAEGDTIESVTVTGSQTVVGTSDNVPSAAVIKNAAGEDVTASYDITYENGTLEVTQKSVTITADSDTKTYDGTALTKDSYTNTALAEGDSIESVTVTGSQTVVGTSNNVPSAAKIVNADGEDVTASYDITYSYGTLEVTQKSVTITADSDTKVYDGTALTKDSFTNTALAEGDSIESVTVTGSQTIVGTSDNVPSAAKIVNSDGEDVTASYDITYSNGTLEVTQKSLTITADSDTKVYDGTALTKDSYTNTALAEGDTIESVTVTGSQTVVGSSDNVPSAAKIVNADGEDVTASYDITYANGTLQVTLNQSLIITADSDTKVYDGTPLTKDSYQVAGLAEGDSIESVTVTGSQTVVGTSDNVPSAAKIVNADGEDVTASYEVTYQNGTLEVTQMSLTITADSDTKVYDGTALTKDSYTNTDLAAGDTIKSVTVTGSQTVVGTSDNVPSAAKIVNGAGEDVTASYKITYNNGTLEVTQKSLTITADSDTKVYDGTALTKDSFTNTALAEGDEIESVTVTGSQTVVGTSDNVPSAAKIVNADGEDVTSSYDITYANGTLEVTKKAITITGASDSKIYDGTALTKDAVTDDYKAALGTGDELESITVTGSQTVVGSSDNVPSAAKIVNGDGEDVTASYEISYANGTLEVTQKAITITADSDSKAYDGTALTKDGYTNTDLAEGDTIESVTVTGSQTVVGTSDNVPSAAKIVNADGEDVTASYNITYTNGTLTVTENKSELKVVSADGEWTYDGKAHTEYAYTVTFGDETYTVTIAEGATTGTATLSTGDKVTITPATTAKITHVAESDVDNAFSYTVEHSDFYTNQAKEEGKLTVKPATFTIVTESGKKAYDGTALTADGSINGFVNNETATFEVTGSQTKVGKSDNTYTLTWDGTATESDYTLDKTIGELEVTENTTELTIVSGDGEWTYDGETHTEPTYTVTYDGKSGKATAGENGTYTYTLATGDVVTITPAPTAKITNVSESDVTNAFTYTITNENQYTNVSSSEGKLSITPAAVTITAQDKAFAYDGTAKSWPEYDVDGLVGDDAIAAVVEGTITYPSESPVTNEVTGHEFTKGDAKNYTVAYVDGELTMTNASAEITITAATDEWTYDGKAHENTKVTLTAGELFEGDELVAVAGGSVTDVKDTKNGNNPIAEGYKIMHGDEDVTANYAITTVAGTLTIKPAEVTITAQDKEFTYDGNAHTWNMADITGLVGDDAITATVEGTITFPSESPVDNVVTGHKFTAGDENNYTVKYESGELTMTTASVEITITAASNEWMYDGKKHEDTEVTVTKGELLKGDELVAVAEGSVTDVADTKDGNNPVAKGFKIMHGDEDVTANYKITTEAGTLTITRREVIMTSATDEKTYDGTPLTNDFVEETGDGWATGEGATYDVTGTITEVGEVKNNFDYTLNEGTDLNNYNITQKFGTLTITENTDEIVVTITGKTLSSDYNGTEQKVEGYDVKISNPLYTEDDFTFTGKAEAVRTHVVEGTDTDGKTDMGLTPDMFENISKNFSNVKFVVEDGSITITPHLLTVTTKGDEKVYDRTALTNDEYTVEGLQNGETLGVENTGSQTLVGESLNTTVLTWADTTETYTASKAAKSFFARLLAAVTNPTAISTDYNLAVDLGTLRVTDEDVPPELVVTKTHEDGEYGLGETVTFTLEATNIYDDARTITFVEIEGVEIEQAVFENVEPGKTVTTKATYTVTEEDILAGEFKNTVTVTIGDSDPYEGEDEVEIEEKNAHLTVTKTTTSTEPENGYALGDTIEYEIVVTNDGNLTITDITVIDELTGDEWTIDSLEPGESETFTASYTVTEEDILNGSVVNEATATGTSPDPDEPDVPVTPGTTDDPTEEPNGHITVEKTTTSTEPDNGYALGDTIEYEIVVKNDGNLTITDITVTDELTGDEWTVDALAPGETETFTATYTVTEQDILNGSVVNEAIATGTSPDPDEPDVPVTPGTTDDPTEDPNGHITVTKTTKTEVPADGFALGDEIEYEIVVENDGNLTITDITVTDDLTGDEWTIDSLEPGAKETFTATYTVAESDILDGSVQNTATATGNSPDPDNPDVPVVPGTTDDPTEDKNPHLTVSKVTKTEVPENGFALGDEIEYEITVTNDGNVTISDITVTDELTGDEWTPQPLKPGVSVTFKATYTVTEDDILAGEVVNVATATGTDPDGDDPTVVPGETEDPTEEKNPHITVTKTTKTEVPENGFALGDKIEYEIVVENDGNVTISNITVTDDLTGDEWTIDSLAPGETATFTAEYTVTEDDILAGNVENVATATGTDPEGDDPEVVPGTTDDPTEDKDPHLTVTKVVTSNVPAEGVSVGDKISYEITVENDGNVTISDITVTDDLTGDEWTIDALAPGESATFTTEYTVTEADAKAGSVKNTATATGFDPEEDEPEVVPGTTDTPVKPEPEPTPDQPKPAPLPNTGDATDLVPAAIAAGAGLSAVAGALFLRRRRDEEDER